MGSGQSLSERPNSRKKDLTRTSEVGQSDHNAGLPVLPILSTFGTFALNFVIIALHNCSGLLRVAAKRDCVREGFWESVGGFHVRPGRVTARCPRRPLRTLPWPSRRSGPGSQGYTRLASGDPATVSRLPSDPGSGCDLDDPLPCDGRNAGRHAPPQIENSDARIAPGGSHSERDQAVVYLSDGLEAGFLPGLK